MGFASAYLNERTLFPELTEEAPDILTGIIVVIPSYNETGIGKVLDSLASCNEPECKVEVIVVINAPVSADEESVNNNKVTLENIESWKKDNHSCFFRLFAFIAETGSFKGWGVGLARKTGMDEAVRRFDKIQRPDGVILNLDADCLVEPNYFESVYREFLTEKDLTACSIYFEHPLSGSEFTKEIYDYITLYELHLRYYFQGLAFTRFPYVFHTVGSSLAVKALPYVKAGGMNRRQAGEDFYFVQKLVTTGGYFSLKSTTVYPSPRISSRVPFGTGASIGKLFLNGENAFLTYNFEAFKELRSFFAMVEKVYLCKENELNEYFRLIPQGLKLFIDEKEFLEKLVEIRNNTSSMLSFEKRFFGWFNMFKIVKYLNFTHKDFFEKLPVDVSASELLEYIGVSGRINETGELLGYYRNMEKRS
jgi:hypothetical protein